MPAAVGGALSGDVRYLHVRQSDGDDDVGGVLLRDAQTVGGVRHMRRNHATALPRLLRSGAYFPPDSILTDTANTAAASAETRGDDRSVRRPHCDARRRFRVVARRWRTETDARLRVFSRWQLIVLR